MKSKKKLLIILSIVVLLGLIAVVAYMHFKPRYRSVKLEEYEGTVNLTRQDKQVEPYKGIMLIPRDTLETLSNSFAALNVDNDKHLGVKENTRININASGTEESGKVSIDLAYGEALFEIENKLNSESFFEVNTPNAVLSVRGTTFSVVYIREENTSKISVEEGTVAVDYGKDLSEQLMLNAGDSVIIKDENIVDDTEETEAEEILGGDYTFYVVRDFRSKNNDINVRGDILLIDKDESTQEAVESGYENDYGIYDTYLASHDEEIKQFIMEAKEYDAKFIFTGIGDCLEKEITDWFPEDCIISLGDKEIKLTEVSMGISYQVYGDEKPDHYQETMMSNSYPDVSDRTCGQAYAVCFRFSGNELK
ncbi:MAG: FecR domain-containing protein [Lachnospiraceae bacterium]|nr:FecR domain-containing protein [Lachnospiraceae bacterium]